MAADLKVPIYATPFTAGLIAGKLEEEGLTGKVKLKIIERGGTIELDPFRVTYVPLAHSIPEGNGLLIETPFGKRLPHRRLEARRRASAWPPKLGRNADKHGDAGVLAMVCDSTNTFQETPSGSESSVHPGLLEQVRKAKGRVLVTTFASKCRPASDHRPRRGRSEPQAVRRRRSLDRILKVARATGYLLDFPEVVRFDEAMRLPRNEVLIVATGGQGEERAALGRVAFGNHELKLVDGDTVIFSSKQIPGNELAIGRIMNALSNLGVLTVTERQAHVHVSGHPRPARACRHVRIHAAADPRSGPRREPPPARAGAVRHRPRRSTGDRPGKWRHRPPRAQGSEEDRRCARWPPRP
jgi:ribonuclease J